MPWLPGRVPSVVLLSVVLHFGVAARAQEPGKVALPPLGAINVQLPTPKGTNPKPTDAETSILAAFDKYEVVAMGAAHGNADLDGFILDLIRNPDFPDKVQVLAVECGNSLYQSTLDQYISGVNVPFSEVQKVWRNTTQSMCGLSGFYQDIFPLVRRINQSLPPERRLRVLACDPPVEWSKIKSAADFGRGQYLDRDPVIAAVMEKEVLSRHRKALMLFGTSHLFHEQDSAVGIYEKDYPRVTLVIADHTGFGNWTPLEKYNSKFEARMAAWPVPSLVQNMKGTWLADLLDQTYSTGNFTFGPANNTKLPAGPVKEKGTFSDIPRAEDFTFSRMADAYLYLGPRDLLLNEPTPDSIVLDKAYIAELQRREAIIGAPPGADPMSADAIAAHDRNPFFYDPDELLKFTQLMGPNTSMQTK